MIKAVARNKSTGRKPEKSMPPKPDAGMVSHNGAAHSKTSINHSSGKTRTKQEMKSEKKPSNSKRRGNEEPAPVPAGKTRVEYAAVAHAPDRPPSLLGDSRHTAAALALLEKGIKLIYQKDFKKARHELKSLQDGFPSETEILARVRTYLQICEREEATHRKPSVTSDQLYTLGVLDHNRGNYDGAVSLFQQSLSAHPDADYVYYSLAASLAMKGDSAEAILSLKRAIELNEDNRVYAKNDSDFTVLHLNRDFTDLVGLIIAASNNSGQY
jgi:tetratricopeptide (TPR) repeat protein